MKMFKKVFKIIIGLTLVAGLYIGGNLIYGTITDFDPPKQQQLSVRGEGQQAVNDSIFTFITWNIGYGGLGKESDFFYDGGETVRMPKKTVKKNLDGIYSFLGQRDTTDFFLLQEVDTLARRSYRINELTGIAENLDNYAYSFATNYNVKFVPVPYLEPMGKVVAGVASYSKYLPEGAIRYGFDSQFSWPTSIYFLDRCFLTHRISLNNGRELIVINTHNSAYDETGELKKMEMERLKKFTTAEYDKGNYVVVGGDWNQCPPGFEVSKFNKNVPEGYDTKNIDSDYYPQGWQWLYDDSHPTNRDLKRPYKKGETFTTLIDYFLVSPNVKALEVKTINMDFEYSDHQPVYVRVELQ